MKTLLLFLSLVITTGMYAQSPVFGITAGASFASYKATQDISITSKTKVGFTAGVKLNLILGKNFAFQPALNFVQKGGIEKMDEFKDKITLNYIEVPLNFVYAFKSASGNFYLGAGPSLSYGISGKDKYDDGEHKETADIHFGSGDNDDLKPFEAGVNVLAGYMFKGGFLIEGNYNATLTNPVIAADSDNGKLHLRYFALRIGIMISGRKK